MFSAFSHTQIPPQQWQLVRSGAGKATCNVVAPVRSLLGYSFTNENAKPVNLCECRKVRGQLQHDCESTCTSRSPWIDGFTRFGSTPEAKLAHEEARRMRSLEFTLEKNNIHGPLRADDEHIVPHIVKILGPQSRAGESLSLLSLAAP